MKTAQCKYEQAGIEITLNLYFDPKAFELIKPSPSKTEEDDLIRLTCDSIAAALPRETSTKYFYIKRMLRLDNNNLKIFCTDGFLTDHDLNIPASPQGYSMERVKCAEIEQLPTRIKLNIDVIRSMNERMSLFEESARKIASTARTADSASSIKATQKVITPILTDEKKPDVFPEIASLKKEIRDLSENALRTLSSQLSTENKTHAHGADTEKFQASLQQKINEVKPIYETFVKEIEELSANVNRETDKSRLFKQDVVDALFEAAKQFHELVIQKIKGAKTPAIKTLAADFNRKFSGIASMSEKGDLTYSSELKNNPDRYSMEDLQKIISNEDKDNPGLLQKCNTSWTEESPELQIVIKQLTLLNKKLSTIFMDDNQYANREMIQITRIPFPRSFQFKFSDNAYNYKKVIDDYLRSQKEALIALSNKNKKILQANGLMQMTFAPPPSPPPAQTTSTKKNIENFGDFQKHKEVSETILTLANKDYESTDTYKKAAKELHDFVSANINVHLKSLVEKINGSIDKIQNEANQADTLIKQLVDTKSQIDIKISHYLLHPEEKPDFSELDQLIKSMQDKRNLLLAKNRVLQDTRSKLAAYETVIRRIMEIDLSSAQSNVVKQRNEAKSFLLEFLKKQNTGSVSNESLRKQILEQYGKVDNNASEIDKIMTELNNLKTEIFTDMDTQADIPAEKLESRFKAIGEKIKALTSATEILNENVSGLRKLSRA